jgi:hypothetical protein
MRARALAALFIPLARRKPRRATDKKARSTARAFFDGIRSANAFDQSPISFHLPPTICTIALAH